MICSGRVRRAAGLVVLHDAARAERLDVDAVDLPRERQALAEVEAAEGRALIAERHLVAARDERQLVTTPRCERTPRGRATASGRAPAAGSRSAPCARLRRPCRDSGGGTAARGRAPTRRAVRSPSSFGMPLKNLCSALCATEPRSFGSTSASIVRGSSRRSTNHADEQSEKRSSSVTLKLDRSPRNSSTSGWRSAVGRSNAASARSSRRSQPFACASAPASSASAAASAASARSRSRSVGASSIGHVSADSGRRVVARRTSSGGKQTHDLVPERARLPRRALVARRLAHEVQPARGDACTRCRRDSGRAQPGRA